MSECSHDCSSCGQKDCGSREIPKEQLNEFSRVKKVIGIVSGKGVSKSAPSCKIKACILW